MPENDRISNPSMGSEELGNEESETRSSGISAGTDTQTRMAAISAQRKKEKDQAILKAKNESEETGRINEQDGSEII
ncbi:MAG: hypothetical protein ABIW47_07995 [Ginsengibacter sp.]